MNETKWVKDGGLYTTEERRFICRRDMGRAFYGKWRVSKDGLQVRIFDTLEVAKEWVSKEIAGEVRS